MSRSKRNRIGGYKLRNKLEFTVQQVAVVEKGLAFFRESLERNTKPLPNLPLANNSFRDIVNKVAQMMAIPLEVSFDYNELVIISACLDMVLIDASFTANSSDFTVAVTLNEQIKTILQASSVSRLVD